MSERMERLLLRATEVPKATEGFISKSPRVTFLRCRDPLRSAPLGLVSDHDNAGGNPTERHPDTCHRQSTASSLCLWLPLQKWPPLIAASVR